MTDPAALVQANRRRIRIRRVALILIAPLLLAGLLFSAKVLSMYAFAYQAAVSYAVGNYGVTIESARWQYLINWFEPYKAPFNLGVGLTGAGDLDAARAAFEESLGLATGLEQCAVRVNLAIVIERLGDAAMEDGDRAVARALWQEALLVILESPEGCDTPEADDASPDPDQSMSETLDEEEQNLREKLEESSENQPPPDDPEESEGEEQPDESESPLTEEQLQSIQEQLEGGLNERDEFFDGQDGEYGFGTERPW